MKRIRRFPGILLTICMVLGMFPAAAFAASGDIVAYPVTGGNIYFDKSTGTITDCDQSVTEAVIPEEIEGSTVTEIGKYAFSYCSKLNSIDIPESVLNIGDWAFERCSSLRSIEIPASMAEIGDCIFYYCSSLRSIEMPESVTLIGASAFFGCSSLRSIEIPEGVTDIGSDAFHGCSSLSSIEIPEGVTNIANFSFAACVSLSSINIPESVTDIGACAFYECSSLRNIEIPDGVTNIGKLAFAGCSNLRSIEVPECVTGINSHVFHSCSSLSSIRIPENVTSVEYGAFDGCSSLRDVYYAGSEEQWSAIAVGSPNEALTNAVIHYDSDDGDSSDEMEDPSEDDGGEIEFSSYSVTVKSDENGLVEIEPAEAEEGEIITVTVIPEEGCELSFLTVSDQDDNMIEVLYESDTEYTFIMPDSSVTVEAAFSEIYEEPEDLENPEELEEPVNLEDPEEWENPEEQMGTSRNFLDVTSSAWYYDAVQYVCENGLMNGTSETAFSPDTATTRGMIVTILHRLEGEPEAFNDGFSGFTDVVSGQYYTDAVAWAAANDIVNGYGDGRFGPNDPITREQMAAILYRHAEYKGYDVSVSAGFSLSQFADATDISSYAVNALRWANAEGLVNGVNADTLNPKGNSTRAQLAVILMRFCENIAGR